MAKKTTTESVQPTAEEAIAVLRAEQEERRQRCGSKIQQILQDESCDIVPVVTIVGNEINTRIDIIPKG